MVTRSDVRVMGEQPAHKHTGRLKAGKPSLPAGTGGHTGTGQEISNTGVRKLRV